MGLQKVHSNNMTQTRKHNFAIQDNSLMEKVVEHNNLKRALERVEKNKGAAGVDGMTTDELRKSLKRNWPTVRDQLLNGTYEPKPVRRVEIPKSDGGVRELGIPTVLDRFIQQAIQQVLTPIFDPQFSNNSYGFRPGRSARQAVYKAKEVIESGYNIVVDIDLEKFFDRVNHDMLMGEIMSKTGDIRMHKIIRKYLQSGTLLNGVRIRSEEGTPQGGPLSPLLSNILLDRLDKELEKRGHKFIRYADDCNIYVKTQRAGQRVYAGIKKFIEKELKLKINELKSAVDKPAKRRFLGFTILKSKEIKIGLAKKTIKRFKDNVRKLTNKSWGISMEQRIKALNQYLVGWSNYFRIADTESIFERLDSWIRRRLRACHLKQWKRCKTKLNMLIKLGISVKWASRIAYSRKKYWRLSKTAQIHKALNKEYWENMGLISMSRRYQEKCISI